MANQTVTSDLNLTQVISNGLGSGEDMFINNGAVVTVSESPSILMAEIDINEGRLFIDGANATNPIIFAGLSSHHIEVNGAGSIETTLGWWEFPTTSDGTANQTFDCSTYFNGSSINSDMFAGVWVETGRRLNYTGGSGIPPQEGDWVFAVNDKSIHGRIESVSGDGITGYIVVRFLTGSLSNGDAIELHTIQDNKGPDYQKSWTALMSGADVLESDVWQEFGNCYQNNTNYMPDMGSGMAGFAFSQQYQSNTLTFGDGTSGFIPPNGARIRLPMIHFCTSSVANFSAGTTIADSSSSSRYNLELVNGGDCYFNGASFGSVHFEDSLGGAFDAYYCAAMINLGCYASLSRTSYKHCVFVSDGQYDVRSLSRSVPPNVDLTQGSDVEDVLYICMNDTGETTGIGGQTSNNINIKRCIQIGNGTINEAEMLRISDSEVYDFVVIGTLFALNSVQNIDLRLIKMQPNIKTNVEGVNSAQISIFSNSSDVVITGYENLNKTTSDGSKVSITDSRKIRVRGYHFFDDPFDNEDVISGQGEEFASVSGFSSSILFARCYCTRGLPNEFILQAGGTSKDVTIVNCNSEYDGEVDPDGINTSYRGLGSGSQPIGTTKGVETDYPGTAGAHFGDIFRSSSTGMIYYRNVPGTVEYPITVLSGTPAFTKDGDVDAKLGDQWEVDMGYVALGHTGFTGEITTARASSNTPDGTDQWTGVDIDFQYDNGSGYNGVWLDLRTPSNLTSITDTANGVQLKLRFTGNSTQANGQVVGIHTTTSLADQQANLHPLDQTTYTFENIVPGSRLAVIAEPGGDIPSGTVLFNGIVSGSVQNVSLNPGLGQPIKFRVRKATNAPFYVPYESLATLTTTAQTFRVDQQLD